MPRPSLQILAEKLSGERALQALFQGESKRGEIGIRSCFTSSGVISVAQSILLQYPEQAVILVFDAGDKDDHDIEERRNTIYRILAGTAPDGWHVTLARPDVDAWLMADPAARAIFEADGATRRSRIERAARIGEIARNRPLDREAIGKVHPEFASLVAFVDQLRPAPLPTT